MAEIDVMREEWYATTIFEEDCSERPAVLAKNGKRRWGGAVVAVCEDERVAQWIAEQHNREASCTQE